MPNQLARLRAERDAMREALEHAAKFLKHREDRDEVCYDWCPACRVDAALSTPPAGEQQAIREDQRRKVCDEIQAIMRTYREQAASPGGVGTPGGLEHMGDVWSKLAKWADAIERGDVER